ncbi:MAG: 50S ribosomal protein L10 [bacterium]|nr:50S ribosomal protein L10 [bacterium]
MPLTKEQKNKIVKKLKENIANQKAIVFVSVKGLKASELFNLRKQLKESNCLLSVAKKTLLKIAFKENKTELNEKELEGQVALIFGFEDELAPAKTAYDFSLKNENLKILGGFLENEFRSREEVIILAKIPSKQELLAKIIGSIKAPISGFANVLQGNIKGLVYLLSNIK